MKYLRLFGFIFVTLLGVLFHFLYDWIKIDFFGIFLPVNESIFEHLKLIIYPTILYMVFHLIVYKDDKRLLFRDYVKGILLGILFTVVAYYTYSGVMGRDISFINIMIYIVSICIVFYVPYKRPSNIPFNYSLLIFCILLILTTVFTFFPLEIGLFTVPQ